MKILSIKQSLNTAQDSQIKKITSIRQQVQHRDRYAIYINDKYSFSLGELELLGSGLKVGQKLNKQTIDRLKESVHFNKLYDQTLNYVMIRPHSRWELQQYLRRKKASAEQIDKILIKLTASGYIDDLKFSKAWVRDRRLLKAMSRRRLIVELRQKHVPVEIINQVMAEDKTDDTTVLHNVIAKKRHQSMYKDDLKLMQFLSRQGYNYGDIKAALAQEKDET
jgi:regulatory protein